MLLKSGESTEDVWSLHLEGLSHDPPSESTRLQQKMGSPQKTHGSDDLLFDGSDRSTRLVLDVFSDQKKILCRRCGNPHSFCFFLVHVKGWRSSSERIEEGITMMMIGEEREFSWLLETATSCAWASKSTRKVYCTIKWVVWYLLGTTWRWYHNSIPYTFISTRKFRGQKIAQLAISGTQSHENPFFHLSSR